MSTTKRALLLGASGLGILSLVAGAFFAHASAASAAPTSANSSTIVYTANPPTRFSNIASAAPNGLPTHAQCISEVGLACFTPAEIRQAYNIPASATGAGQTIVIVDAYGSPTISNDLHVFDQEFGLQDPTLNIIYPGGSPTYNPLQDHAEWDWAFETSLDVEWAHAIAPAATIDLVVASNSYGNVLNNAESYAVQNHLGNVMSMSFGAQEADINGGGNNLQLQQAHAIYQAAQAANISVFASAGDSGAAAGASTANASYPASDPLVTAVGGTNLFITSKGAYDSETVWNDANPSLCPYGCLFGAIGATGGAPSSIFSAPSYQSALSGMSARTTSDVSYDASVYTAVWVYISFPGVQTGFYFVGGTSSGSPQWAAIAADADQAAGHALGFLNPTLYAIGASKSYAKDFHDVTVGDNGFFGPGFSAQTGYDLPTGLGTPNVANLIATLAQ